MALLLVAWNEQWKSNRAAKRARREEQEAIKASRHAPSLVRPPEPIFSELVSTQNEAVGSPNESWDAILTQTFVQDSKGGWRVPLPEEQPANADVWRILRRAHEAPQESLLIRILKKVGLSSNDDADVRVSNDEAPYKSKNPYLPQNVYESPPRAQIRTPSGLFVSTARVWEIQVRAYVYGREHGFQGLEMHVAELEKRFRAQRLIV